MIFLPIFSPACALPVPKPAVGFWSARLPKTPRGTVRAHADFSPACAFPVPKPVVGFWSAQMLLLYIIAFWCGEIKMGFISFSAGREPLYILWDPAEPQFLFSLYRNPNFTVVIFILGSVWVFSRVVIHLDAVTGGKFVLFQCREPF